MARKEQEAKAKKSKMNKKKGKKKYKGKAGGFTPRKPKPEHATQQSSDMADQGRKPQDTASFINGGKRVVSLRCRLIL